MKTHIVKISRAALFLMVILFVSSPAWSQNADTILVNGKILTVDTQFSTREAMAIRDGKIAAVGGNSEVQKLAGPQTRVIDLSARDRRS